MFALSKHALLITRPLLSPSLAEIFSSRKWASFGRLATISSNAARCSERMLRVSDSTIASPPPNVSRTVSNSSSVSSIALELNSMHFWRRNS
uniref:Putative secreted protein n=1 Tax=Anopheles darlingi TaxID=43151 RepID=A0A2M4DR58_ANODA